VVFRDLLAREAAAPSWSNLLNVYRRLEARGEIRGGRFIEGFVGEQFALPQAVDALRAMRREASVAGPLIVAAADPLNLVGILTPGARLSPYSNQAVAYENGAVIGTGLLGELRSQLQQVSAPQPG
jgi:ATP-dependent Lhr-like helicase